MFTKLGHYSNLTQENSKKFVIRGRIRIRIYSNIACIFEFKINIRIQIQIYSNSKFFKNIRIFRIYSKSLKNIQVLTVQIYCLLFHDLANFIQSKNTLKIVLACSVRQCVPLTVRLVPLKQRNYTKF